MMITNALRNTFKTVFVLVLVSSVWLASPSLAAAIGCQNDLEPILTVASPISDHMVLQQGQKTGVWGKAKAGGEVSVEFAGQKQVGVADENGDWMVKLEVGKASKEPRDMRIESGEESIRIEDVLVGEVWMCSGQSNMAFTMARAGDDTTDSDFPLIRIFNTPSKTATSIQSDCGGQWQLLTPQTAASFSAVAYHFGTRLHHELDVPIGLINTAWGGKPVEAFTSMDQLKKIPDAQPLLDEWNQMAAAYDANRAQARFDKAMENWKQVALQRRAKAKQDGTKPQLPRRPQLQGPPLEDPNCPAAIYNRKVAPWTRFSIAGAIWYQGEANRNRAVQYQALLAGLIEDWRKQWNDEFPFYIVQLANYQAASTEPGTPNSWAELQNAQTMVAQNVAKSGIAIANDIGDANDIHPKNKRDVGLRLARLALHNDYGKAIEPFSSPLLERYQVKPGEVLITMNHVGKGLKSRDGEPLKRFEIAGKDQQWHWADAEITAPNEIRVSSNQVADPVAVRYAWASNPTGANLVNSDGLPASLFRTDDWPLSTAGRMTRRNPDDTRKLLTRQGFRPLFNGENLNGWTNPYEWGQAKVEDGEILLTGNKKFFLVTEKQYSDFVLVADVKLPEGKANSGIMFRCHVEPNKVYGYQAEVDGSDRRWSGGFYDEGRRSWIWPSTEGRSQPEFLKHEAESKAFFEQPKVRNALDRDGWNRYEIECRGDQITIKVNGVMTADVRDSTDAKGYIGLQHHGEKGQTYRFRNVFIKPL